MGCNKVIGKKDSLGATFQSVCQGVQQKRGGPISGAAVGRLLGELLDALGMIPERRAILGWKPFRGGFRKGFKKLRQA